MSLAQTLRSTRGARSACSFSVAISDFGFSGDLQSDLGGGACREAYRRVRQHILLRGAGIRVEWFHVRSIEAHGSAGSHRELV